MINKLLRRIAKPAKSRQFNRTLDAGISYLNGGQLEKALTCFDELIRIDPSDAQAYRLKGSLYTAERDYDRALINYDKAVELGDTVFDATYGDVEAYIARGHTHTRRSEYAKAAEDFKKALDLDSVYAMSHCRAAYERGVSWTDQPIYSHDIIRLIRQRNIMDGVKRSIDRRRSQQGLPNGLPRSVLGMAAYRITENSYDKNIDGPEQLSSEFSRFIREGEGEYEGWKAIAYYREAWAMDTSDEEIISGMTVRLCQQIGDIAYEDVGFGITCSYTDETHSRFSVFIAIGFGLTDGSAYAVMRINQAREDARVPRLTIDPSLRAMARKYRPMAGMPDDNMIHQDTIEYRYLNPGFRARYLFNGARSPFLKDILPDAEDLLYADVGKLAAAALLSDHNGVLLRSDWQDIAVTTTFSSTSETEGPRVEAEFLIGWRLPEGTERPSHFPPPPERTA